MPIDYLALRNEILNGPKSLTLVPLFNAGDDTEVARILNIRDERGPVPINELSALALDAGLYGHCDVMLKKPVIEGLSTDDPPGNEDIHRLASDTLTLLRDDFRLKVADVDTPRFQLGLTAFVALGWITQANRNAIEALAEDRLSRSEIALAKMVRGQLEYGSFVTATDVSGARI